MAVEKTLALLSAAALVRLSLFVLFPSLPDLLMSRPEVATPMTAFKRLQEGVFLYSHGVSPFNGGVYHQVCSIPYIAALSSWLIACLKAPLLLPLFSVFPDYLSNSLPIDILYIATDLLSALALMRIADSGEAGSARLYKSPRRDMKWSSTAVGAAFLFNPFAVITCIGRATSSFTNCAILVAVAGACSANFSVALPAIALAAYLSMYPLLLAPPLAFLLWDRIAKSPKPQLGAVTFFTAFTGTLGAQIGALLGSSYLLMDQSWEFLSSTYGNHLMLTDLTPNTGVWWYFFIEMFDSFRDFFLGVFWLHMASYVTGLTIRFRKQPLFAIVSLLGIFAIFKPYPSISDAAIFLSVLPLYRHVFPLFRYGFIAAAALLYATFLGPAFYHLWVYAGSGNANFFYAITLVWSLGLIILLSDALFAVLRDELEAERPELKGKDIVQT